MALVTRIADQVIDLAALSRRHRPRHFNAELVTAGTLELLLASGSENWRAVRSWLQETLNTDDGATEDAAVHLDHVAMQMPFQVADYVDFYASEHHASNVGQIFRPGQPPLLRTGDTCPWAITAGAGTVVVSGTDITRPHGRVRLDGGTSPMFQACRQLDVKVELGFVVGVPSALGRAYPSMVSNIMSSASPS